MTTECWKKTFVISHSFFFIGSKSENNKRLQVVIMLPQDFYFFQCLLRNEKHKLPLNKVGLANSDYTIVYLAHPSTDSEQANTNHHAE